MKLFSAVGLVILSTSLSLADDAPAPTTDLKVRCKATLGYLPAPTPDMPRPTLDVLKDGPIVEFALNYGPSGRVHGSARSEDAWMRASLSRDSQQIRVTLLLPDAQQAEPFSTEIVSVLTPEAGLLSRQIFQRGTNIAMPSLPGTLISSITIDCMILPR